MTARFILPRLCLILISIRPTAQAALAQQRLDGTAMVKSTGSLNATRSSHTATLLQNGQVLVAGGSGFPCTVNFCYSTTNNTAELYDPVTGSWRLTGSLSRRGWHSATLLPSGQVLVAGGLNLGWDIGYAANLNTAEIYDPGTGLWRATGSLSRVWGPNNAVLLPTGKVLVVGKDSGGAELFDPSTETWTVTAAPTDSGPLTLLRDGKVLIVTADFAELYNPATEEWSRAGHFNVISSAKFATLTMLRNGTVLATGFQRNSSEIAAELYDPETQTWTITGFPNYRRWGGTMTPLPNGQVLLAGGWDPAGGPEPVLRPMELYDPGTGTWKPAPSLRIPRVTHTATLLRDDKVLFAAGIDGDYDVGTVWHNSAELFDLGLPRPISLSIMPGTVSQGQCFTIIVGNGSNITLDVQYRLNGGDVQTLPRWPSLNADGRAENICTSLLTPVGTFEFIAIRNTDITEWLPTSASISVTPAP